MNVEQMTNEELISSYFNWKSAIEHGDPTALEAEVIRRLRTYIPKPVIKVVASGSMTERDVTINGRIIAGFMPVYAAENLVAILRRAIGIEGDEQ